MLGDRGLCERQFVHDVAAHPRFLLREHPKDADADRMGNRFGENRQLVVRGGAFDRSRQLSDSLGVFGGQQSASSLHGPNSAARMAFLVIVRRLTIT